MRHMGSVFPGGRERLPASEVARVRSDLRRMVREQLREVAGSELDEFLDRINALIDSNLVARVDERGIILHEHLPGNLAALPGEMAVLNTLVTTGRLSPLAMSNAWASQASLATLQTVINAGRLGTATMDTTWARLQNVKVLENLVSTGRLSPTRMSNEWASKEDIADLARLATLVDTGRLSEYAMTSEFARRTTVVNLSSTVTTLESEVTTLKSTTSGLESTTQTLRSDLSNVSGEVFSGRLSDVALGSKYASLTSVTSLNSTVGGLSTTVNGLSSTVGAQGSDLAQIGAVLNEGRLSEAQMAETWVTGSDLADAQHITVRRRGTLAASTNLNTLGTATTHLGVYQAPAGLQNSPTGSGAGTLEVLHDVGTTTRILQRFTDSNRTWWRRSTSAGTSPSWSRWRRLVNEEELNMYSPIVVLDHGEPLPPDLPTGTIIFERTE